VPHFSPAWPHLERSIRDTRETRSTGGPWKKLRRETTGLERDRQLKADQHSKKVKLIKRGIFSHCSEGHMPRSLIDSEHGAVADP
jgi:hypothetical protein